MIMSVNTFYLVLFPSFLSVCVLCLCVGPLPWSTCGGQRTTLLSHFPSSTFNGFQRSSSDCQACVACRHLYHWDVLLALCGYFHTSNPKYPLKQCFSTCGSHIRYPANHIFLSQFITVPKLQYEVETKILIWPRVTTTWAMLKGCSIRQLENHCSKQSP